MKGNWIRGRKRTVLLVGVLLITVAGVGTITIADGTIDEPFAGDESEDDTDASTPSESDDAAEERASSANEENSTTPPSTPAEPDSEPVDDQVENDSGVNLVPGVQNFSVSIEEFNESSPDVEDEYVTPGEHRLLRFDMITYNVGDADAELGRPEDDPDSFVESDSHDHAHLRDFNTYVLFDDSGDEMDVGKKQPFCLMDIDPISSHPNASSDPQFDCDDQGISAGWSDTYDSSLPGQYLVIDSLPDGNYTLQATTNAEGTIEENCYDDNTVRVDLRIVDDTVTVTDNPQTDPVETAGC